ncbi:hypothetical protein SH661x_001400 [Planctomicrobium sp. SH661]
MPPLSICPHADVTRPLNLPGFTEGLRGESAFELHDGITLKG